MRARLRYEVKALQRRLGITTIMVTHDQEEALTMADRIVVMNDGVIEQAGAPTEIYSEPASVFVADFIGIMNFIAGEVTGGGEVRAGGLVLACDTSGLPDGARVTVAIRPEDIVIEGGEAARATRAAATTDQGSAFEPGDGVSLRDADAPPAGAAVATDQGSVFEATVNYIEFLGSFARAGLAIAGERLLMDLPIAQIRRHDVRERSPVRVVVPRDAVRIYAEAPPDG